MPRKEAKEEDEDEEVEEEETAEVGLGFEGAAWALRNALSPELTGGFITPILPLLLLLLLLLLLEETLFRPNPKPPP